MALFGRKKPAPEAAPAELPAPAAVVRRSLADHLDAVLRGVEPLRPFGMQINDVTGLTLCEDIVADLDLPMVTTARVAGYGVRAANLVGASELHPIDLRVQGIVERTDAVPPQAVAPGGCVLMAEGAPAPKGVDALVPLDEATIAGRVVTCAGEVPIGAHLSVRGSALAEGTQLLAAGSVLDARAIGLLAEVGLDKVLVRPQPRLVVLAVGDDLVAPGHPVTTIAQRYSSATSLFTAAARADGSTVYSLDNVPASAAALSQTLSDQAIRADAMVVLASTDADARLAADVLGELGPLDQALVDVDGRHLLAIGRVGDDGVRVLVLPGSAVTGFGLYHALVRPLLDRLGARSASPAPRVRARLASEVEGEGVRFVPVRLDAGVARPVRPGAELALDLFRADALAQVSAPVALGDQVDCVLLADSPAASV